MSLEPVRAAYGARVAEYIDAVGSIEHVAASDLALVSEWARGCQGLVLDVGCGPGQWTHYLAGLGIRIEGIDPVVEFVESARASFPDERFRVGRAQNLDVEAGSLGGVLAWFSLIHSDTDELDAALKEFARCIGPGGGLALGFFGGPNVEPFDHAITTAFRWPVEFVASKVEAAGFVVTHTESRGQRSGRTNCALLARRA